MENSLLTGFLFPKIIADQYELEDTNSFIATALFIDRMQENKSFSLLFQMLTAQNADKKQKTVIPQITSGQVITNPDTTNPEPNPEQEQEDDPGDNDIPKQEIILDKVEQVLDKVDIITEQVQNKTTEQITKGFDQMQQDLKMIDQKILDPFTNEIYNSDLKKFLEQHKIDHHQFNNGAISFLFKEVFENICKLEYPEKLKKIKNSKKQELATLRKEIKQNEPILQQSFALGIQEILKQGVLIKEDSEHIINILTQARSIVYKIDQTEI